MSSSLPVSSTINHDLIRPPRRPRSGLTRRPNGPQGATFRFAASSGPCARPNNADAPPHGAQRITSRTPAAGQPSAWPQDTVCLLTQPSLQLVPRTQANGRSAKSLGYSLLVCLLLMPLSIFAQANVLALPDGKIRGTTSPDAVVRIFKGIPFAAPPVGPLRWQAPQPVKKWKGVKDCTDFSASPVQADPQPFLCWTEEFIAQPEPLSEDCLYLNVWSTATSPQEKQPVIVWIYGGGFSSGSANCAIYDGEEMSRKGIVFVSLNYRVGVLGFMAHPELSKEAPYGASGNYGLLDQVAALQWVRENIAAFGGDPDNVTIAGQSAGAFSVTALITSPLAQGLFARAIPQSGGILADRLLDPQPTAEEKGLALMKMAGASSLAELRALPAAELQKISTGPGAARFGLTLDGHVLPQDIVAHYKAGNHSQVPVLTGWVTGDGSLFGPPNTTVAAYQSAIRAQYGDRAEDFFSTFPFATDDEATATKSQLTMLGFAGLPAHRLAGYNSAPTYLYEFSHVPPAKENFPDYGAFHTAEVPYALHTLHTWHRNWQDWDKSLENIMASYWVNFAKTGNPNGSGLPRWEAYTPNEGFLLELGDQVQGRPGKYAAAFRFLDK